MIQLDVTISFACTYAMATTDKFPSASGRGRRSRVQIWKTQITDQRRRLATLAAAVLVVGVAYGVMFGHNGLTVYSNKRAETRDLDRELKSLGKENSSLAGHVERLQSDPNAIEHQAREELHYTRPGEVIVTLPPDHPVRPVTGASVK